MLDVYIEAEYEDGYIHREDEQDHSPYVAGKNIFSDILEQRPVPIHGRMVRFSLIKGIDQYNVDWLSVPDNARPIRFKHMEAVLRAEKITVELVGIDFGYQYTDENGKNQQTVISL